MSLPVSQLGWMAGILDLRGKILRKANKLRRTQQIVLAVDSKQMAVIRELSRMTGTRPEPKRNNNRERGWYRRGCLEHCEDAHIHVGDGDWVENIARWTVTGSSMAIVLHNVTPFLHGDNGLAEALEEALEQAAMNGRGSGATLQGIRRLQELGWDLPSVLEMQMEQEPVKELDRARAAHEARLRGVS